jgi:hypothetical protein
MCHTTAFVRSPGGGDLPHGIDHFPAHDDDRARSALVGARQGPRRLYADWPLLQEREAGRAPYRVRDAEVLPGDHILMFERIPER